MKIESLRLAAARGAIHSLTGELMQGHICNHMPRKTKSSQQAAADWIEIVRTQFSEHV